VCHLKRLYAAEARFHQQAFAENSALPDNHGTGYRSHAACAAALAGSGQGEDGPKLRDEERIRWRKQALDWLRADLALLTRRLENKTPLAREQAQKHLQRWQHEPELAGLRDPAWLAKLAPQEQQTCRKFWADVDGLLQRTGDSKRK
jgi:hypothetical protein